MVTKWKNKANSLQEKKEAILQTKSLQIKMPSYLVHLNSRSNLTLVILFTNGLGKQNANTP